MADQRVSDSLETASLFLQVDTLRAAGDLFKFTVPLHDLFVSRIAGTRTANTASLLAAGDTTGASALVAQARTRLGGLVRNAFNFLGSQPVEDVPGDVLRNAYTAYGFAGGLLGDLESPARGDALARQLGEVSPGLAPAVRLPANLLLRLTNWLAVLDANLFIANGGTRQSLNDTRDTQRELLDKAISRGRHFYCAASDAGEATPELARVGLQPKRAPGEAQPQPLPEVPGAVTFDAETRELRLAAMPAHGTSLRAYRQAAGAEPEVAGVSTGPAVSVVGFGPLQPGKAYTFWLTGKNSRGEGPASARVTFQSPA